MYAPYYELASVPDWQEGLIGLMYHAVEAPPLLHPMRGLYVEPSLLEAHIHELQEGGINIITLSEWVRHRPASRSALLTFDDAFQSSFENALPVLTRRGVVAINYVVAGEIGGINRWDAAAAQVRPLMDRQAILDWLAAGQEIGSHTISHQRLAEVSLEKARTEIFDSKKMLEDLTGRTVPHFCYPYGNWSPAVRDLVAEAGYETATTVQPGINQPDADPFTLSRHAGSHRYPYRVALKHRLRHPFAGAAASAR